MTALGDDATVPVNPNLLEADQGGKGVKPYNNHLSHARVERRVAVRLRRGPACEVGLGGACECTTARGRHHHDGATVAPRLCTKPL